MELSSAAGASTRFLGLTQRYRRAPSLKIWVAEAKSLAESIMDLWSFSVSCSANARIVERFVEWVTNGHMVNGE
ncbi:hypothetical protein DUI87_15379 [Hirundo rustica rustica]|uniref:Uncharacterized protein n=1 Tax=Hirundo rustica rustica TaxID=333673 RepID=A0A3M0K495_HIRRU|nr:hypothetical protein DUI87_15379 [Hirundo rustica rustica]